MTDTGTKPKPSKPARRGGGRAAKAVAVVLRLVIIVGLIGVAGMIASAMIATRPQAPRKDQLEPTISVRTVVAAERPTRRWWEGYGTARAIRESGVAAEVGARVIERPEHIEEGAIVEKGDVLARLDPRDFRAAATSAEQQIRALEADLKALDVELESVQEQIVASERTVELFDSELDRMQQALERGGTTEIELDRLERNRSAAVIELQRLREQEQQIPQTRARLQAQLARLESDLDVARINLERTVIVAPFTGVLQSVDIDEGERVTPGQTIAMLVDPNIVEIPLRVPTEAAGELDVGDAVRVQEPGEDGGWVETEITRIAPRADERSRTLAVFAVIDRRESQWGWLRPGAFVRGQAADHSPRMHVVVPRSAIDADRVLIVSERDGAERVEPRPVRIAYYAQDSWPEIHPSEQQWAVLSGGITPGERIVVSVPEGIATNTKVRAVDVHESFAASELPGNETSEAVTP